MIVVLGASSGIGKELIPHLASLDSVIATYNTRPNPVAAKGVTQTKLNLLSKKEVDRFGLSLSRLKQKITLINLAALSSDSLLAQMSDTAWEKTFQINLHSTFLILKRLLPKMIQDKWGRVILTSSVVAENGAVGAGAYSSSKSALLGLNKAVAQEYGRFHITSNLLMLGYFDKGLIDTLSPMARGKIMDRIPAKKLGNVANIFQAVKFIMKADYLNGSVIRLDGGLQ